MQSSTHSSLLIKRAQGRCDSPHTTFHLLILLRELRVSLGQCPHPRRLPQCISAAIGEIASRPPSSIKNKAFCAFDYEPTGDEISAAFTKALGRAPKIVRYSEDDYERDLTAGGKKVKPAVYK